MTLPEWTSMISAELTAAGFEVTTYHDFPLVRMPMAQAERVRLLEFQPTLRTQRRIYAEGMLFLPAGSWEEWQQAKTEQQWRDA
jgi:hypothetical protein